MASVIGKTAVSDADSSAVILAMVEGKKDKEERQGWTRQRNNETKAELKQLEQLKKVAHSFINKLERTQLQKMRDGPLHKLGLTRKQSFTRSKHKQQQQQQYSSDLEKVSEVEENSKQSKTKRKSWVVGQFGGQEVKDLHKTDREELNNLRSMGVVGNRLKQKEKVREQAVKFFKHRYELDPESAQKSSCILVTGTESEQVSATEFIRQQSTFIINKMFDQPSNAPAVLSRLTSNQQHNLEGVVLGARGGKRHYHTVSEPQSPRGGVGGEGEGAKRVKFQRGQSMNETRGIQPAVVYHDDRHGDESHMIHEAISIPQSRTHSRTKSAPHVPLAPPLSLPANEQLTVDMSYEVTDDVDSAPLHMTTPTMEQATPTSLLSSDTEDDYFSQVKSKEGVVDNENITSSPRRLKRSPSYTYAIESEDIVTMVTDEINKPEKSSSPSPLSKKKTKKTGFDLKRFGKILPKLKAPQIKHPQQYGQLANDSNITSDSAVNEGAEFENINDDVIDDVMSGSGRSEEDDDIMSNDESPKHKPHFGVPQSPPLDPCQSLTIPRPPGQRFSPQFSVTSLSGPEGNSQYYTKRRSPHIPTVTEKNPFEEHFDRALHNGPTSGAAVPMVTRSNTQLPDDILSDEGFCRFLEEQDAKPSKSLYITYQINLISHQIDNKYGKHLNQALDDIIDDVIAKQLNWENFNAVCKTLLFKGEDGLREGLFMVPAFGRRLLGFLPGMRDVITQYTQAVFEEYAMDWLLMRGGWGELFCHFEQEEDRMIERYSEREDDHMINDDSHMTRDEMYDTAMGYGLITPSPDTEDRSLAQISSPNTVDISDVGGVVDHQVSIHDDRPHPLTTVDYLMGSDLFLAPLQEIASPIGRGLRRVNSVEVLFITYDGCHGDVDTVARSKQSFGRVSSLPSLSSSIPSPSTPISIPSRKKHLSTDHSSISSGIGMGFSPSPSTPSSVFTLPSMRSEIDHRKPHPQSQDSMLSSSSSSSLRHQSSITSYDSSIHIITTGGDAGNMSPSTPSSPVFIRHTTTPLNEQSHLATHSRMSQGSLPLTTTTTRGRGQVQTTPISDDSGQTQATPISGDTSNGMLTRSETPPTNQSHEQATPPNQAPTRTLTSTSSDSYADYGLDNENENMTELELDLLLSPPAIALSVVIGFTITYYIIMR